MTSGDVDLARWGEDLDCERGPGLRKEADVWIECDGLTGASGDAYPEADLVYLFRREGSGLRATRGGVPGPDIEIENPRICEPDAKCMQ